MGFKTLSILTAYRRGMTPYKYEIIDGTTYFRYRHSDLKEWLLNIQDRRSRGLEAYGLIFVERTGGRITHLSDSHIHITTTWFTLMDGPFPDNFDDKALEPPIPLYGHPESPFQNAQIFMPLADEKKV